jgi:hypothetical protein
MQRALAIPVLVLLAAAPCFGTVDGPHGPLIALPPPNPCPGSHFGQRLATRLIANEVGTDAGGPACPAPGSVCAETMVVCMNRGRTTPRMDPAIDIIVQMFTATGDPAGMAYACEVPPDATVAFVTGGVSLPAPYTGTIIPGPPVAPLGSLRILTDYAVRGGGTINRAACDVTLIDVSSIATGATTVGPGATKGVTVTPAVRIQWGD